MDKNQITGILLIFIILLSYTLFFAPEPVPTNDNDQEEIAQTDSAKSSTDNKATLKATTDPEDKVAISASYGNFSKLLNGKAQDLTLENEDIKITFNTEGGTIKNVLLKKYTTFEDQPLVLLDKDNNVQKLELNTTQGGKVDLYKLFYKGDIQKAQDGSQILKLKAQLSTGKYIEQVYSLSPKGFLLDYQLNIKGLNNDFKGQNAARFQWVTQMKRLEWDLYYSRYYSTINYNDKEGNYNYLTWPSTEQVDEQLTEPLHWVSFKQRFFNAAFIAKNKNLQNALLVREADALDSATIRTTRAYMDIPTADLLQGKGSFSYYFGPNDYSILTALDINNLEKNVHLGYSILGWISEFVIIPLFNYLEQFFTNYGVIILILVFIIKTCLLPLTYSSYKSMAKMRVMNELLKPELDAFKKKQGLDKGTLSMEEQSKVQQEQSRLYQELGSSPLAAMSGCLPMLLQTPIFIALFFFFPNAIQLRHESFLWATDLSHYDSILNLPFSIPGYGAHVSLFTLLMTVSTLGLTYLNSQSQATSVPGPMKYMGYVFPVVFMFVLNSYPAGLSFYYLVQNLVTIGQQTAFKKFLIDENKIRAQFEEYKKKNKDKNPKKSWMQQKLEEAQKKQIERDKAQKQKAKNSQNKKAK